MTRGVPPLKLFAETRTVLGWPAGPPVESLLGHIRAFARDQLGFLDTLRPYGDLIPLRFGPRRAMLVNHPDLVEEVLVTRQRNFPKSPGYEVLKRLVGRGLVTSEGELWRRQRRLMQPAFHRACIYSYGQLVEARARQTADRWTEQQIIDVHVEMTTLTLGIVSDCLFGLEIGPEAKRVTQLFTESLQELNLLWDGIETFLPAAVPTWASRGLRRRVDGLDHLAYDIIKRRRREGIFDGDDLLSLLLRCSEEGSPMADKQLRDEIVTLLFAGHETTAGALTWAWYLLGRNPAAAERLQREAQEALGQRNATADDLPNLPFAEAVVKESLRLFPPAPMLARQAQTDCELAGCRIPAGTIVLMSQWLLQRDPRYFDRPTEFRPERWLDPSIERLPKFAYFPFSGGPRMCIGEAFALMEGTLVLATLAKRFQLLPVSNQAVRPRMALTLRPEEQIWMRPTAAARPPIFHESLRFGELVGEGAA